MLFRHRLGGGGAGEINIIPRLERAHDRVDDENIIPPQSMTSLARRFLEGIEGNGEE